MKKMEMDKNHMKNAFNRADKSGDGSLDSHEFIKFLHDIDIELGKDDLETILLEVDDSHDESVSFTEFYNWYIRKSEDLHV